MSFSADRPNPSVDPLDSSSTADLFGRAQQGCRACLDQLMRDHEGLVHFIVQRQVIGRLSYAEAVQVGRIGLWRAILGYDPNLGFAFSTYASQAITFHLWRAVKKAGHIDPDRWTPEVEAFPLLLPSLTELDPAVLYETAALYTALYDLVRQLPERLRTILIAHYGLGGGAPQSFRQIGQQLGLSHERVRQLHLAALMHLRHPAYAQQLHSLLGRHTVADYQAAQQVICLWRQQRARRRLGVNHG